ncbi:MAG: ATP-binding protein, partial [Bdellovibrionia bacterium]
LLGDLQKSQGIVKCLLEEKATPSQQIPALLLFIQVNTALGNLDIAVQALISTLQPFGMSIPLRPTQDQIIGEYSKIWDKLGDREISELAHLPLMTDEKMKTVMTILSTVLPTLLFFDPNLLSMVLCKMVQISLQYGNSPASTLGYVFFGMNIGPKFMMYSKGYAFGHLAYQLIERNELSEFKAQVIHCFATFCNHWKNDIATSIPILNRAFAAAVETNDMLYTCYCKIHSGMLRFVKGDHLNEVLKELSDSRVFVNNLGFIESEEVIAVHQQLIKCLIGSTVGVSGFTDATFNEEKYERNLGNRFPITRCWFYIRKTIACCILDNHTDAITSAQQAIPLLWTSPSFFEFIEFYYYYSISLAAQCEKVSAEEKKKYIAILLENEKMFKEWSKICPNNFKNIYYLIHAELLKVTGESWKAAQFYEKAIRSSEKSGFIQKQAICYQAAAQFFGMSGITTVANEYIWKARELYSRWGANGKVRQLDGRFPELIMRKASLEKKMETITSQDVDLMSVIQASQAISGELLPERLLNSLCEILLKQSGAQTGYILLAQNGVLTLAAKASGTSNKTEILLLNSKLSAKLVLGPTHGPINSKELPISVIQYTLRTLEKVALHDATQSSQFRSDVYIKEHRPKSILSVPMKSQGKLIGIVYLENNLVPGAFTPEKIKTLELITLQAAISIEISMVYTKNQEVHRELQRILDSTSVVIYIKDIKGKFIFVNERFERTFHLQKDNVIGKTDFELFEQEKATELRNNDKLVIETRSESQFEELLIQDDGVHTYISVKVPLFDLDGNLYAVCGISTDITERKKVETQRIILVQELEKTIRVRDEFIAIASHELKTPLTSLRLQISLMMEILEGQYSEKSSPPNLMKQVVTSSQRQTERLVALTNELLDISTIKAGKFAMEFGQFNLSNLLLKITDDFKKELSTSRQEFVIAIEDEILISGDPKKLEQVFINLINNALKFGLGRPIEISLRATDKYVEFFVRDHGLGIKKEDLVRIFEPFERAVSHRNYGGLGLGLYISKVIVDAHQGQIEVVSSFEKGALFRVTLPKN